MNVACPNCGNNLEDVDVQVCPYCTYSLIDEDSARHDKRRRFLLILLILMLIIATPMISLILFFPR